MRGNFNFIAHKKLMHAQKMGIKSICSIKKKYVKEFFCGWANFHHVSCIKLHLMIRAINKQLSCMRFFCLQKTKKTSSKNKTWDSSSGMSGWIFICFFFDRNFLLYVCARLNVCLPFFCFLLWHKIFHVFIWCC